MSRSRRKTPITGNTLAESEKTDKQLARRAGRKRVKELIRAGRYDELPEDNEGESWGWAKDGKQFFDEEEFPNLMRK